jgi:drug/metabolite transporter (DMT)-like permease
MIGEKKPLIRRARPLPGVAAICLYLLLLSGTIIYGVVSGGHYPPLFLVLAALLITASAGLIASFRWAWALALGAVFLLTAYFGWLYAAQHQAPAAVQGLLNLVFFLYLIRPEVRERLR